jgi:nucleoside-diphosphate-sugar epimerase
MAKILITGATGFVGSSLTKKLIELGHEVHITYRVHSNMWRLHPVSSELYKHNVDLRDGDKLDLKVKDIKPEIIFHLATFGGLSFQNDADTIFDSNYFGARNLLRSSIKYGTEYFVNTGSSSEYGIKDEPMSEKMLLEPINDYGVAKASFTMLCKSEAYKNNVPIATLRLFSPYGPFDDPVRFMSYLISSAIKDVAPQFANKNSVRDYVYIDDVVDAYLKVIENKSIRGEAINIGSGNQYSLKMLADMVYHEAKKRNDAEWGVIDSARVEPNIWKADIALAQELLNWTPLTPIEEGLSKSVSWYKSNIHFY